MQPAEPLIGPDVCDVHSHFFPAELPDFAARHDDGRWPHLVIRAADGAGEIRRGTELFRVVRSPCWDLTARLDELDRAGIGRQVISPVPITLTYWADPGRALDFSRVQNDALADVARRSGGRLVAFGGVPLQDVDLAVGELERVVVELGLPGVEIGTVVGGRELDDPALRPFFAAVAELGAALFVHPIDGAGATRCDAPLSAAGIGMLTDTALAATALVFGGVLAGHPALRVCLSHGGGTFPWCYPRLRLVQLFGLGAAERDRQGQELDGLVRRLSVDGLVFDEGHLPLLGERFGFDQVMLGSDYPFLPVEEAGPGDIFGRAVQAGSCSATEAAMMRRNGNALVGRGATACRT